VCITHDSCYAGAISNAQVLMIFKKTNLIIHFDAHLETICLRGFFSVVVVYINIDPWLVISDNNGIV